MDRIATFSPCSWTSRLPLICSAQDFLNLLHSPEILYLLLITCQAFPRGYGSLLGIHLVLVGYSATPLSSCRHDLLDLVSIHHDRVQGFFLLSLILSSFHFSSSCQCFPPPPMHTGKFSCLTPLSLHLCYTTIY
jgi:hypothetical protein